MPSVDHAPAPAILSTSMLIIVDTLTAGRDLKSVEQKIKAQSKASESSGSSIA